MEKDTKPTTTDKVKSNARMFWIIGAFFLLVLIALAFFFIDFTNYAYSYETNAGEIGTFNLPGGSTISLNGNSSFAYDIATENSQPQVNITGRAYFLVKEKKDSPLVILADGLRIISFGGELLVKPIAQGMVVIVNEGEADMEKINVRGDNVSLNLKRGEMGMLVADQKGLLKMINRDKNHLAWLNGRMVFDSIPISQIIDILMDVYKVNIEVSNIDLLKCRFSASYDNRELDDILQDIGQWYKLKIEKVDNGYLLEGKGC